MSRRGGGGSSACRLEDQHKRHEDGKVQFNRMGGQKSFANKLDRKHNRLEDTKFHHSRMGGGGSFACGLENKEKSKKKLYCCLKGLTKQFPGSVIFDMTCPADVC